jgi:hypothetical protein
LTAFSSSTISFFAILLLEEFLTSSLCI